MSIVLIWYWLFMNEMDWSVLRKMESHGKERKELHRLVWIKDSKLSLCMIQIFLCWEKQAQGSLSITCMIRTVNTTYSIIGWLIETKMQLLSYEDDYHMRTMKRSKWNTFILSMRMKSMSLSSSTNHHTCVYSYL